MKRLQQVPNQLIDSINLDLRVDSIDENGAKYLGEGIAKCVTLTSLDLKFINQIISLR